MNHEALRELQDAINGLKGADDDPRPPGGRANEPESCSWHPLASEVHERVNAIAQDGESRTNPTFLNLDELTGAKESGAVIVGLDVFAGNLCGIEEIRDRTRLRTAMARGYGLPPRTVGLLCDGPNWIGDARAWITPQDAVRAIFHAREGKTGNDIWYHLQRDELLRWRDAEPREWYAAQRFEQLYDQEHAGAQHWPSTAREHELQAEAERKEYRIGPRADIHTLAVVSRQVRIENGARIDDGALVRSGAHVRRNEVVQTGETRE